MIGWVFKLRFFPLWNLFWFYYVSMSRVATDLPKIPQGIQGRCRDSGIRTPLTFSLFPSLLHILLAYWMVFSEISGGSWSVVGNSKSQFQESNKEEKEKQWAQISCTSFNIPSFEDEETRNFWEKYHPFTCLACEEDWDCWNILRAVCSCLLLSSFHPALMTPVRSTVQVSMI